MTDSRFWSGTKLKELRLLIEQGLTSNRVAVILGITRNAAIGQARRQGLKWKCPPVGGRGRLYGERPHLIKAFRGASPPLDELERKIPRVRLHLSNAEPIDIHALKYHTCRWPLWDIGIPFEQKRYCGAHTDKPPYCEEHRRRAGQIYVKSNREPRWSLKTRRVAVKG